MSVERTNVLQICVHIWCIFPSEKKSYNFFLLNLRSIQIHEKIQVTQLASAWPIGRLPWEIDSTPSVVTANQNRAISSSRQ